MNTAFTSVWRKTHRTMQRIRPRLEHRARLFPGHYPANLAHEWRLYLMKSALLE